jgi:hypothetical protein
MSTIQKKAALCFIISYTHVLHHEQLWRDWIRDISDIINVYVHYSDYSKLSPWLKQYALTQIQRTTYADVVPAYIAVLSQAYNADVTNSWFCLLTDTCAPVISPAEFRARFEQAHMCSIMRWKKAHWNVAYHPRANLARLPTSHHLCNDPWFVLCRAHVLCCITFVLKQRTLYKIITSGGIANESLFAIILVLYNPVSPEALSPIINESASVADWVRPATGTSPHYFHDATQTNTDVLERLVTDHPYAMFARKFNSSFPSAQIRALWDISRTPTFPVVAADVSSPSFVWWWKTGMLILLFLLLLFFAFFMTYG